MTSNSPRTDPYEIVDPDWTAWAKRHSLQTQSVYRDDVVRSTWITGPNGKAQIWLGWPISVDHVEIFAAKLDLSTREKWSSRAHRVVLLPDFATALEETFQIAAGWVKTFP
jgi:hypothetical protein